jgi:hypothetical protein
MMILIINGEYVRSSQVMTYFNMLCFNLPAGTEEDIETP